MEESKTCIPSVAKTLKHEAIHFIVALIVFVVIAILSGNYLYAGISFVVCMFLDADHLVDYGLYLIKFKRRFSLHEFLSGAYFQEWKTFITPLHSWELAVVFLIIYGVTSNLLFFGLSLALIAHYFVDYFTNDVNKKAYFLVYRMMNGFKKTAIAS